MAEQYISIKVIHDRITRHPLMQSVTLDAIITYTVDFMRIVGVPAMFVDKVVTEKADGFKVKLPCDYYELNQLRGKYGVYRYANDTFHMKEYPKTRVKDGEWQTDCRAIKTEVMCDECDGCPHRQTCLENKFDYNKVECITLLKSTTIPSKRPEALTFRIQNGYIYISKENDEVDISYRAILTDDSGLPMIPDNSTFTRALMAYIKQEYFTVLFDMNIVTPQVLQQAQQDYAWAVGACETDMNRLDISKAESLFNMTRGLLTKNDEFNESFKGAGDKVILKAV